MKWFVLYSLVFAVYLGYVHSNLFDNLDDWEDAEAELTTDVDFMEDDYDEAVGRSKIMKAIKSVQIKKKCDCKGQKVCGCCMFLLIKNETSTSVCFNATEVVGEKKVEVSLVLNDKKLYTKKIGEKKKCATVPYTGAVAKACLQMYNMTIDTSGLHACIKLGLQLFTKEAITFDFNCLKLSNKTLSTERPSDAPGTGIVNIDVSQNTLDKVGKFFKNQIKKIKNVKKPKS